MAQDVESESELRNLAAVPYQLISPANNSAIIGIFQDSMLGCFRFTRENVNFTARDAMNLLMMFNRVNEKALFEKGKDKKISSFEILSQIMPPMSIQYKTKRFGDNDDFTKSNQVIEIKNGKYIRGQLDKSTLGAGTKGLIQRTCNDFGNMTASDFIDDLQNIVTEYMKSSAYSVGISDLISDNKTNQSIIQVITEKKKDVKKLIDQTQIGIFENNTGKTNQEEFETQVNNILNQASAEAGKIGLKSLNKDNRFVIMENAGSKGSELNIAQMISCLGQQNVDGKRIPYGFEQRTLPHFTKFDDSPLARGFVESSYINGLSPQELFFHAMGGRVGLIDTAVKSVTWETPIVIIENKQAKYIEIGKWIDQQLEENPREIQHFTERQMELLNINEGDVFIPTTDENGIVTWGEITAITRHDPGTELYEIKTKSGRNVIVTESKSLLIWNPETKKLKEMPTPEIKVGDRVPVTNMLCEPPILLNEVNMQNYLSKTEYVYGTDFNIALNKMKEDMTNKQKIQAGWWEKNNGIIFTLPYSKKSSLQRTNIRSNINVIKDGYIYPYHAVRKNTLFKETFELNEENGIFIGLFLAEGNASKTTVTITNLNENIKDFVKHWFDKHNIEWTERERINKIGGKTNTILGNCALLSTFLKKWLGHKAENKYVPSEAFIANENFIKGLLNGYYSGDGSISKNSIDVGSASKRLIEGISMLCSRFGIFGKVSMSQLKQNNLGTKNIKPTYRFAIRAQYGKIFAEKITLLENNKNEKLKRIVWKNNSKLFQTYNDVLLDEITEINIIGVEKHPKVYDLTIPSTLNFGLANGLQVRDTSTTGYIQRRIIKGLEDLMVNYDMTLRTNKGKIVQFTYGDDGIDAVKIENQQIPIVGMSIQEIYAHYNLPDESAKAKIIGKILIKNTYTRYKKQQEALNKKNKEYTENMIQLRNDIIQYVFKHKGDNVVNCPVAFAYIINNIQGQQNIQSNSLVDITPLEVYEMIEQNYEFMEQNMYVKPTKLFKALYNYYLSPKDLLFVKRFNRSALTILLETISLSYKRSIVAPGEMVGMIAAQSIGEVSTQMSETGNTQHKIICRNKLTNEISLKSIIVGEFCDDIIMKNPDMTFNTGHENSVETLLNNLDDEYYIVGVSEDEKTSWNKISHISRHPVNGEMMKVTTRSGRTVETTTSHSHLVRGENHKVVPIVGANMKEGMRIPVSSHIDDSFIKDTIEINNQTYKLDHLFGWFVGAYLAEGNLNKNSIAITNISEHYIENTKKFAERFGKECNVRKYQGEYGKGVTTKFNSKEIAELLLTTCDTGSFVKRVPDFAFTAPQEFKAGLFQGYFDGDGNFNCDKNHHEIRCCSRSEQLIKDLALILNYFNIFGVLKENTRFDKPLYHLNISPKYSKIYKEKIGTVLHQEKLDNLIEYIERNDAVFVAEQIDKINGLEEIVAHCGKILQLPGQSRIYGHYKRKNIKSIGRRTLEKYYQTFKAHEKANLIENELCILKQAITSNVVWDEITKIEYYRPDQQNFVYDFTVPGNQTFMTDYGVIVHNTLNSVTYETDIIVRNKSGEIKKVQIGEFIENKINIAKKLEYYKDKDTTYAELEDYYEIPSCDEDGNILWKQIEAVTKHPVINKDGTNTMLKITTHEEREVIATKAKSFLKLINGKITAIDGDSLKVGDYLPVSNLPIDFTENRTLELRDNILCPSKYIYASEVEKAKLVMNERNWWSNHQGVTFRLPYARSDSFVAKVSDKLRNGCKSKTCFTSGCVYTKQTNMNNYTIPETIQLDYNFGYLLGAYSAEGCMTKTQISISNNDIEYFEPILKLCADWNITTKIYKNENKNKEGWTSQDLRIYNTVLCHILENLCGKLSHNKFVSDKIIFSNKECLLGFLDAYIGGDGSVKTKEKIITMSSVSKNLLIDVQQILNILNTYSYITKYKKQETNNRGSKNIKQLYNLFITGSQIHTLASMLNIKIKYKQENLKQLLNHDYKYNIHKNATIIPNEIDGKMVFQKRDDMYSGVIFDKIKTIEEVSNTTNYAYDLTVADTRNFNTYNGLAIVDTFHFAGVSSKSNVTRGVPRIEEILSLSSEPKNPSLTVYLNREDEADKEKASAIMYMIEHTKLEEIVESVEICFDPDDLNTLINEDKATVEQYRKFESMMDECNNVSLMDDTNEKSKWIVRMTMDPNVMLEKNITMDDVNFTLKNSYGDEINCIYSDYNDDKLIFRIRMNNVLKQGAKGKKSANPLDQSDHIYILKNFQDQLLQNIVLRGIKGINKVILRKIKDNVVENSGVYKKQDIWVLDTVGTNMMDILALDYIDPTRTFSNDIVEIFHVLGIEAARQAIYNEIVDVIEFDGTYINSHHFSVLCDRMTATSKMISIFRHGINNDNIGPIAKASFEETPEMFLKAAKHAELDTMKGISANVMMGQEGFYGTSVFQVVLDLDEMMKLEENMKYEQTEDDKMIEEAFGEIEEPGDSCSTKNLTVQNNVVSIKYTDMGGDNDYNPGFM
uniref:DNA-directed RNA polymerase n=1 Tax=viral metagenome TaxID=1070528 RepID=A0A6C0EGE3_9ZZZZ